MTPMDASYNYNDIAGLHNITKKSGEDEAGALKDIARQFESMFVKMMLKTMRDANAEFEKGGLFDSHESKFYRQMFDDQLVLSMSQGKGIGLADTLYRQLSTQLDMGKEDENKPDQWLPIRESVNRTQSPFTLNETAEESGAESQDKMAIALDLMGMNKQKSEDGSSANASNVTSIFGNGPSKPLMDMNTLAASQTTGVNISTEQVKAAVALNQTAVKDQSVQTQIPPKLKLVKTETSAEINEPTTKPHKITKQSGFESPQEFVETLWPVAQKVAKDMGVDPKAIMAQAALETGWGKHIIHQADGKNSHNLFGIKADHRWDGESARVSTLEYRNGVAKKEIAPFRSYESYEHSLKDYSQFIMTSSRYTHAVKNGESVKAYSEGLQNGGYATDPNYAKKIQRIAGGEVLNQAIAKATVSTQQG